MRIYIPITRPTKVGYIMIIVEEVLSNEDNNELIEKYMKTMGIRDRVDFNNTLNRYKIYKRILEENADSSRNLEILNYSENKKLNQEDKVNLTIEDISSKLLSSYQENSKLSAQLKEYELYVEQLKNENQNLTKENKDLKERPPNGKNLIF